MRAISQARFDAFVSYCREPPAALFMEELAWYETGDADIFAALVLDTDDQYSAVLIARDGLERYRWVNGTECYDNVGEAVVALQRLLDHLLPQLDTWRIQGDEQGRPVDFFTPVVDVQKLHENFVRLTEDNEFIAARGIIDVMMRWHEDIDGNFVEQFQTTGFDARIWELYLFATLVEAGFKVSQPFQAPDFLAVGLEGELAVEATTINPSVVGGAIVPPPTLQTDEEINSYYRNYLPIRFAGPLTAKLKKKYWERPHVSGKPFVIAIQDFRHALSMTHSRQGLATYLYGVAHEVANPEDPGSEIIITPIENHILGAKSVPSGFFNLPESENISAVIFNDSGTISKFNRMGVCAGFGSDKVVLIREGFSVDPSPNAWKLVEFIHVVGPDYRETWIEGMDVYHNPKALNPLDRKLLPGATHHILDDSGQLISRSRGWKAFQSTTTVVDLESD